MKQIITEWERFLKEEIEEFSPRELLLFDKNIDYIAYVYERFLNNELFVKKLKEIEPEKAKILTQIEIDEFISSGAYGKVFKIKNNDFVIKIFSDALKLEEDIQRIKKISEEVFSGKAVLGKMHFFEVGKIGKFYEKDINYVIMPKIIPFLESPTYMLAPQFFNIVGQAIHKTSLKNTRKTKNYSEFYEDFIDNLTHSIKYHITYLPQNKIEKEKKDIMEKLEDFPDTISKIVRLAYKTILEEGGTDLHLGNLGYFAQKPDDWFYFDM